MYRIMSLMIFFSYLLFFLPPVYSMEDKGHILLQHPVRTFSTVVPIQIDWQNMQNSPSSSADSDYEANSYILGENINNTTLSGAPDANPNPISLHKEVPLLFSSRCLAVVGGSIFVAIMAVLVYKFFIKYRITIREFFDYKKSKKG